MKNHAKSCVGDKLSFMFRNEYRLIKLSYLYHLGNETKFWRKEVQNLWRIFIYVLLKSSNNIFLTASLQVSKNSSFCLICLFEVERLLNSGRLHTRKWLTFLLYKVVRLGYSCFWPLFDFLFTCNDTSINGKIIALIFLITVWVIVRILKV